MADAAASDLSEGPVLSLINKRLRALRKKFNRILQMEESIAQGKTINKEQEEVLRSKPGVAATIDELEKLRQPLAYAVQEERSLSLQSHQPSISNDTIDKHKSETPSTLDSNQSTAQVDNSALVLEDLLNVIYFGFLFDVNSQNDFASTLRMFERKCCLTYDYVTDDATEPLSEKDLDLISMMSALLISRPPNSSLPHKNALEQCIEHAKLWIAKSDQPVEPNDNVTYAGLRERLNKILSSEYMTITPMEAPIELAAAAAAGEYAHFPAELESSVPQLKHQEEGNFQDHDAGDQYIHENESQKDEEDMENIEVAIHHEQIKLQAESEFYQRDTESKEHQYYPRRNHQNQRGGRGGGGRRGYSSRGGRGNGRGSSYQNGRGQYYDQPGNYYPRQHYYRGRGGRGGGHTHSNHHGSVSKGSQITTDGVHS